MPLLAAIQTPASSRFLPPAGSPHTTFRHSLAIEIRDFRQEAIINMLHLGQGTRGKEQGARGKGQGPLVRSLRGNKPAASVSDHHQCLLLYVSAYVVDHRAWRRKLCMHDTHPMLPA